MSTRTKAPRTRKAAKAVEPSLSSTPVTVLLLRTCNADMTSKHGQFRWPESGPVECPDWSPKPECGHGLHGLLWGEGSGQLLDWSEGARWLVVEAVAAEVVPIDRDKAKFPRGVVVHCGNQVSATSYLAQRAPAGSRIVGGTATAGVGGTATAGYRGTATAGDGGTIIFQWWDAKKGKWRVICVEVGEGGIESGVAYQLQDGKPVKAETKAAEAEETPF